MRGAFEFLVVDELLKTETWIPQANRQYPDEVEDYMKQCVAFCFLLLYAGHETLTDTHFSQCSLLIILTSQSQRHGILRTLQQRQN
jgi:hypothetical protein